MYSYGALSCGACPAAIAIDDGRPEPITERRYYERALLRKGLVRKGLTPKGPHYVRRKTQAAPTQKYAEMTENRHLRQNDSSGWKR